MSRLICLEPADPGAEWAPFAGARPIAELRAGAWRIRDRWAGLLGLEQVEIMGSTAEEFADVGAAPLCSPDGLVGPAIVVRSDFAPSAVEIDLTPDVSRLTNEGVTVAWRLEAGERWEGGHERGTSSEVEGLLLRGSWDLITALEHLLGPDCAGALATAPDRVPDGVIVLGDPGEVACYGAEVEPGVVFDVRQGVVVLEDGVTVRSGSRLTGPLFVGPGTELLGGSIKHSSIGPVCRVHGELSTSVFLGFANKSHDGFVGHSVLGQWANLGAGTITSNLKNTYGEVRLDLAGEKVATGRTFLGAMIGDHAKTGIGSLLGTGTIIGTGANVVGAPVPRWVPPFAWGAGGTERLDVEGFVRIAKRVMPRRQIEVGPAEEASLRALHRRLAR